MKSYILFPVSIIFAFLIFFNNSGNKIQPVAQSRAALSITECTPENNAVLLTAAEFKARYGLEPLRVRKNVDSLTQAEINAIKVGLIKMKALPYTNPTSYGYQVAIHGTSLTDNLLSWNMCHRPGEGNFFLAWHRMYCYFFERILRAKSGRANLTLPYWNYQLNPVMHPAWRDKSNGNPLYESSRGVAINGGSALPSSISTAINNSLAITTYYTFQSNFNSGPHGSVHTSIGGNMAVITTAVKDPVFWLHHSNVDRLWEQWRGMCGGRTNPTDTTWLNKTYTFFDENGTPVSMRGQDIVEISTQLNYRYDDRPAVVSCRAPTLNLVESSLLLKKDAAVEMNGQTQQAAFANEPQTPLQSFIRTKNRSTFNFANENDPEMLTILLDGVNIEQMPQGVIEVYLNLPAGATPVAESNYFVGLLDLFSAQHYAAHHTLAEQAREPLPLDATKAAKAQGLSIPDLRNATLTFIARGLKSNGREITTTAHVTIRGMRFMVDRYHRGPVLNASGE